ncbi:hypothetical protein MMC14_008001 [Varicellaria rhodocarpa]|nr:hypothetical protein [Varicellaria rhodocarpa]
MLNLRTIGVIALGCLTIDVVGHNGHGQKKRQLPPRNYDAHNVPGFSRKQNDTIPALNPQLTNTIPNNGGPTLYYNASGPVPPYDELSPVPKPFTPYTSVSALEEYFYDEIVGIISNQSIFNTSCLKCIAATEVMHLAAITQPVSTITDLLIRLCNLTGFSIYAATCESEFSGVGGLGPYWAQLFAKMSIATGDMQAWCSYQWDVCDAPPVIEINESLYFSPKPESANVVPEPSGEIINVLHLSDWHLDPRYDIGSEADCSQYLCCRPYSTNTKYDTGVNNATVPASRFGYLYCDAPADLALSSFSTMSQFFNKSDISFAIFTGDIVSHDDDDQLSRAYIEYEETVTYQTFKAEMGGIPIYPTLGNHDSLPEAYNTPNNIDGTASSGQNNILSWNYDLLSSMWQHDGWINSTEQTYASNHYGAYAHTTKQGLKIISINTDFWYTANIFNLFNLTNPDQSGIFSYLSSELAASEATGQRVWIIGHVLSGYDGTNALPNPSALFYSIVARFSPATIAGVFFGHTHEDQLQIFYDYNLSSLGSSNTTTKLRNTTDVDYTKPLTVGYIGPSITPLTGNNAGYQVYQVDAKTFSIVGTQTYFANVSESLTWSTPEWQFEYDSRSTYDVNGSWPSTAPLNATFYDNLTKAMLQDQTLVEIYNLLETKSSVVTKNCTSKACGEQKVCYIRSGSSALGLACPSKDGPF